MLGVNDLAVNGVLDVEVQDDAIPGERQYLVQGQHPLVAAAGLPSSWLRAQFGGCLGL